MKYRSKNQNKELTSVHILLDFVVRVHVSREKFPFFFFLFFITDNIFAFAFNKKTKKKKFAVRTRHISLHSSSCASPRNSLVIFFSLGFFFLVCVYSRSCEIHGRPGTQKKPKLMFSSQNCISTHIARHHQRR